jgi:hypothetical protein
MAPRKNASRTTARTTTTRSTATGSQSTESGDPKRAVITRRISGDGVVYDAGDEERLQSAIDAGHFSHEDVTRMTRTGAISGFSSEPGEDEKSEDELPQGSVQDPTVRASIAGRTRRARMTAETQIDEEATGERPASEGAETAEVPTVPGEPERSSTDVGAATA